MVNFVCRTCLYVGDNEYSFRKVDKVRLILELFIPELRSYIGSFSMICEQCYYFLKNVEKFKLKCMETQSKLYTMNLETIRDSHEAILKSIASELFVKKPLSPPVLTAQVKAPYLKVLERAGEQSRPEEKPKKRGPGRPGGNKKAKVNVTTSAVRKPCTVVSSQMEGHRSYQETECIRSNVHSTKSSEEVTSENISTDERTKLLPTAKRKRIQDNIQSSDVDSQSKIFQNITNKSTHFSTDNLESADLLDLLSFDKEIGDLQSFRDFAVKPSITAKKNELNTSDKEDDDDEYFTREDLIKATSKTNELNSNEKEDDDDEYFTREDLIKATSNTNELNSNEKEDDDDDEYFTREDLIKATAKTNELNTKDKEDDEVSDEYFTRDDLIKATAKKNELNTNKKRDDDVCDEYFTREDLVKAGLLPASKSLSSEMKSLGEKDPESDEAMEFVDTSGSESDTRSDPVAIKSKKEGNVNSKCSNGSLSETLDNSVTVKTENDEENPGFFNKLSVDGYYKCRLCDKRYKNSRWLSNHTREKHTEVKIYHCEHCAFFTIWRSALSVHYNDFHGNKFEIDNSKFACFQCYTVYKSKEELHYHMSKVHNVDQNVQCHLCNQKFSDKIKFAKHVEKEHLSLDMPTSSNFCQECGILFLTEEDYGNHVEQEHKHV